MSSATAGLKSNGKMRRMISKKSHSWWWDSHISPKNSKWLAENLEEMDRYVKEMLKLIEDEGDSFAKKAEMYYQKRPELISHVEGFYRMYRALAERYDHVTGELRKNLQSDLHSQSSWSGSDFGSEPPSPSLPTFDRTPELKPAVPKPSARAAGFEFFLGSGGSSDLSRKESDRSSSSSSESDSDSDDAKEVNGGGDLISSGLQQRIFELENELCVVKEKLGEHEKCGQLANEKHADLISKIAVLENDCLAANEKLQNAKSEITSLHQKLKENNLSPEASSIDLCIDNTVASGMETQEVESVTELNDREREIEDLKGLISAKDQEIEQYKAQLAEESGKSSQEKLRLEADIIDLKEVIEELKSEVTKISQQKKQVEARISMQQNLIEEFKATSAASADRFSLEKSALKTEISILSLSNTSLSAKLVQLEAEKAVLCSDRDRQNRELNREIDGLKLQVDMLTAEKDEMVARIGALGDEMKGRDDRICSMDEHMNQLHLEHVKLIAEIEQARRAGRELAERVKELDEEVERQRAAISDGAEGKREAIRQLCFSLEHYRDGYHHLRRMLQGNNRRPQAVMAV
ncbi:protein NETWORKED 4B-like [Iris pallida]|uniref:Protein NETWORKED 4B-like n=1 Tax=Iris pallida TaxID=29817 RepID=A0AAX6EI88_IRIPA|nr:protein NETWORKED 4B-like [Iris pallida]KAJ6803877.1 protein NETWORKED 4B-like [Iris pallida]